jgi:hypothetical protein
VSWAWRGFVKWKRNTEMLLDMRKKVHKLESYPPGGSQVVRIMQIWWKNDVSERRGISDCDLQPNTAVESELAEGGKSKKRRLNLRKVKWRL